MKSTDYTRVRTMLRLNRKDFAKKLGIHVVTARKYERGRVKVPVYIAYACSALAFGLKPYGEGDK